MPSLSIASTQVVSRVREAFGVELAVRSMFETPTVAGLAEEVEALSRQAHGMVAPQTEQAAEGRLLNGIEVPESHGDLWHGKPSGVELLSHRFCAAGRAPHHRVGVDDLPDRAEPCIEGGRPVEMAVRRAVIRP